MGAIRKAAQEGIVKTLEQKAKEEARSAAQKSESERIAKQNALNQQAGAAIENQAATARARRRGLLGGVSVTGGEQTLGSNTYL